MSLIKDKSVHSIKNSKKPDNSIMIKIMLIVWMITLIPLIVMFAVYTYNPDSPLLNYLSEVTSSLPAMHSANNPLLSSVMSAWCKTAPFWGCVVFLLSFSYIEINDGQSPGRMIKGLALFSLLYYPIIYMLLLHPTEITDLGKLYRVMSQNDYFMFFLFATIYTICYISTVFYLMTLAATFKRVWQKLKSS